MIRPLVSVLILLLALSFGSVGAMARHIDHCGTHDPAMAMPEMNDATGHQGIGGIHHHDAQHSDVAADPTDTGTKSCESHLCPVFVELLAVSTSAFQTPIVVDGPADTSASGLSRPKSLYRPPEV